MIHEQLYDALLLRSADEQRQAVTQRRRIGHRGRQRPPSQLRRRAAYALLRLAERVEPQPFNAAPRRS